MRAVRSFPLWAGAMACLACGSGMRAEDAPGTEAERGAAHVEKTCRGCHPGERLDAVVRRHVAGKDAAVALEAFLPQHHVPDAALRAGVVAHLRGRLETDAGAE